MSEFDPNLRFEEPQLSHGLQLMEDIIGGRWNPMILFVMEQGARRRVYLHRWLLDAQPGQLVDHIDGNKLNNRRSNLRLVTRSQNQANRRHNRTSRSRYKGVTWHKRRKRWMARIQVRGRRITIGYYADALQAAYEYDAFARSYFGEYARVNFPRR